jgi:hypothetical protein
VIPRSVDPVPGWARAARTAMIPAGAAPGTVAPAGVAWGRAVPAAAVLAVAGSGGCGRGAGSRS